MTDGLTPLPQLGGPNFDVYGTGPDHRPHAAFVYPDAVNYQAANGAWRDLPTSFSAEPSGGWSADVLGVSLRFPPVLSAQEPVGLVFPGGTMRVTPKGATAAGLAEGGTLTYPDALPSTDLVYVLDGGGYAEEVVLKGPDAAPSVTYEVAAPGFDLVADGSSIELLRAGESVATATFPVSFDSASPPATAVPTVSLTATGSNRWEIQVSLDPAFLDTASYPITIDPTWFTTIYATASGPYDDTYVDSANPTSSFYGATRLWVSGGSPTRNAFIYFDTSALERDGVVVYPETEAWTRFRTDDYGGGTIEVRRPTSPWPVPMTWNNQPPVAPELVDSHYTYDWTGWWWWQVDQLYQRYLDTRPSIHQPNHGFRLSMVDAGSGADIVSSCCAEIPFLRLYYNNLPSPPVLDLPAEGFVSENDTPTLKVKAGTDWPTDPDGESVLVQVQVSDDPQVFEGGHLAWQSGWSDERAFVVPPGALVDGTTYYWRAQSWDVCIEPSSMCATNGVELMSSAPRSLVISLKHFGDDPRYAMWSHDAGNGVSIEVNEANGNLFLDVPLDSLATPVGDLGLALSYNSQQNADFGLTPGWSLDIGPSSSVRDLPIELVQLQPSPDAGIKIRLGGGRALYFPHRERKVYASMGPGTGVVKQNADGTFLYTAADGGQYEFSANGKLVRANPVASAAAWGDFGFAYTYNAQGELQSVTDPLSRAVTIDWVNNRPETITAWTGETWTLSYTGSHLSAVRVHVTNPVSGATNTERVGFEYDAAGTVSEIDNGVTSDALRTGWTVTYLTDPTGLRRVSTVKAPPGLASSPPTPWTFEYSEPYRGTTATYACITDPLGTPGVPCAGQHQTKVDFNTAGLPIGITGPKDQTEYLPVTTLIWDSNNNLVCRRTPAANAALLIQFDPAHPLSTACQDDARSSRFDYRNQAPFQLLTERRPVGNASGTGSREVITYDYDRDQAGAQFNGLWAEVFANKDLRGIPKDSLVWRGTLDMNEDWGTGSPANLPQDNFSIRWTGLLDVSDFPADGRKVAFRLTTADEGASLVVVNSVLLDCLGTTQIPGTYNCGTSQDVSRRLLPGYRPIVIEYSDPGGSAAFKLEWDQGTGNWEVLPTTRLQTNLGVLTKTTRSSGATSVLETKYSYATDWELSRQLPTEIALTDLTNPSDVRRTTLTYGQYGQVLTTTTAAGTAFAATTTNDYTFNAPTSCLTRQTDPTGAVANFTCSPAGDVLTASQVIRATALQPAQTRTTTTTYDELGRVVRVLLPSGGYTDTVYDKAGRAITVTRNLGAGAGHDPTAVTTFTYDDAGHLLTETLPRVLNPATGQLASPVITHTWDWLDTETRTVDVRGKTWSYLYDASGRLIKTTSPSGLVTETEYRLVSGSTYANQVTTWSPPGKTGGVASVTTLDVNGRVLSDKLGTLTASSNTYDPLGRIARSVDPAGVATDYTYNGFDQVRTTVGFATSTTPATTTSTYDAAGRLASVDGPRTDATDVTSYGYELAGRLTGVTQQGITLPGANPPSGVTTTYAYDDAGELVLISQPLTTTLTQARRWTYDTSGRQVSYVDARGTTTYTYGQGDQLEQIGDPRGITLRFEYDNLGRQTRRYRSNPSVADDQTFTYDQAGNPLTARVASTGTTITMEYDLDGRPWRVYQASGTPTTTYTYSSTTGLLSQLVDPAGTTSYTYRTSDGLLDQITDPFGYQVNYTYDAAGRVYRRTDGSGTCWQDDYEAGTGRIQTRRIFASSSCTGTYRARFMLTYDAASNISTRREYVAGNTSGSDTTPFSYTYDAANRLLTSTAPSAANNRAYTWDGGGNRISAKTGTANPVTMTYDAAGLPVSSSDGVSYTHDALGNLTLINRSGTKNDRYFTYSSWNGLTKSAKTANGSDIVFTLDALDRVLTRVEGSTTAVYTYSGTGEVLAKAQVGSTTTLYANAPEGPLGQKVGTTVRYYLADLHGDLVGWSDTAAAIQGTAAYDPFGLVLSTTGAMGTIPAQGALRFQSDLTDLTTGQVDMGARSYEPLLGRFTSADPLMGELTSPLSLNRYLYGMASPITYSDPTGLRPRCDTCTREEEQELVADWAQAQTAASAAGTGAYAPGYSAVPPPAIHVTTPAASPQPGPDPTEDYSCSALETGALSASVVVAMEIEGKVVEFTVANPEFWPGAIAASTLLVGYSVFAIGVIFTGC